MSMGSARSCIGFACLWDEIPERTWSYTPWNLRAGLRLAVDVIDIGVQIPRLPRTVLKIIHTRRRNGRMTTTWSYSRLTDAYNAHVLHRELFRNTAARRCDAVLTIGDLAVLPVPFFTYQDLSYDALISASGGADPSSALLSITSATMARRRERQLAVYDRATGIIAMSHWFARTLVEQTGLPRRKVHVVHPGTSAGRALQDGNLNASAVNGEAERNFVRAQVPQRAAPRRRLLFVGNNFYRKGGDLVVAALALLRRDYDPKITLTVVGPKVWPLPGNPPDGVRFLGLLPPREVGLLYDSHDLFVMPSRMEPFGIVFAEALARGLPCIARDAYAMPEIITPGVSGSLITRDDETQLASTIAAALADDTLYTSCYERASEVATYFSWERAGREIAEVIAQSV